MGAAEHFSILQLEGLVPAHVLAGNLSLFPEERGIYVIAGRAAIPLLDLLGYYGTAHSCHGFIGREPIIYVGAASSGYSSIRKRAADHLFGDSRKSTFRQSIGVALASKLNLRPVAAVGRSGFHFGDGEKALSTWICSNLALAYTACRDPIGLERIVMKASHPPFNIKEREWDPFAKLAKVKRPHDAGEAHPIWTDEEVEAAIEEAIARKQPGLARAIALGRWGGFRRKTICALPLTARVFGHASNGLAQVRLHWITEKKKVACDKREDPRLTALLDRTPDAAATIAYNADGHPFKERQLNQAINRLLLRLGTTGQVRTVTDSSGKLACPLDIHGLRHARGTEIALAGGSDAEIMTQLEHATDRAAKIYRRQADRRRMADAAQDRIDEAIERQTARKTLSPEQRAQPGTVKPRVKEL